MPALTHSEGLRRWGAVALRVLVVAAVYYGTGRLGLLLGLVRAQVTPLWPPTGIAVAALLLLGLRVWPGITLGALLVNLPLGPSVPAVLVITLGNTLAPLCAYLLLTRGGFRPTLDRLRDGAALVFLGALAAMLVSASVGTGTLVLSGAVPAAHFWPTWLVWWTGDAMGVLVFTPLVLVLSRTRWPPRLRPYRCVEAALLVAGTGAVAVVSTSLPSQWHLSFVVFPFLIWAALRFQLRGAVWCVLVVSVVASHAAVAGTGAFAAGGLLVDMVTLQAFNGSAALTGLLLATLIAERNRAYRDVERVCTQLADVVTQFDRGRTARYGGVMEAVRRAQGRDPE